MEGFSFNFFGASDNGAAPHKGLQADGAVLEAEEVPVQAGLQVAVLAV